MLAGGAVEHRLARTPIDHRLDRGELILHPHPAPLVEAEGARGVGVDQVVARAVGEVELEVGGQVGGEQGEHAVEVDAGDDHAARRAGGVHDRGGELHRRPAEGRMRAALVVDAHARHVDLARCQREGVEDVGVVALLLQRVAIHAQRRVAVAVDPHALEAVVGGADQADLEVGTVGLHRQGEQGGELRRSLRVVGERGERGRVAGEREQGAREVLAHQGDAPRQHAGGGEQLRVRGVDQQGLARALGLEGGDAGGEHAGQGEDDAEAGGEAEPHGASTRAARSPERMRSHSRLRRSTSSTGSSQTRRSVSS